MIVKSSGTNSAFFFFVAIHCFHIKVALYLIVFLKKMNMSINSIKHLYKKEKYFTLNLFGNQACPSISIYIFYFPLHGQKNAILSIYTKLASMLYSHKGDFYETKEIPGKNCQIKKNFRIKKLCSIRDHFKRPLSMCIGIFKL